MLCNLQSPPSISDPVKPAPPEVNGVPGTPNSSLHFDSHNCLAASLTVSNHNSKTDQDQSPVSTSAK